MGFDVRAGGDEKQKINFAWPKPRVYSKLGQRLKGTWGDSD